MAAAPVHDKAHREYSGDGLFTEPISSRDMATEEHLSVDAQDDPDLQDWRLEAELDVPDSGGALHELIGRLRGPDVVKQIEASVQHDVVITHDGKLLFAYAADRGALAAARSAIEEALAGDGIQASIRVSHWDDELEKWRQTDPPLTAQEQQGEAAAVRDANEPETRTLVVSSGKMIRAEFEQSIREWADKLELQCSIVEHPHLLTTQVAFTVIGPKHRIDEFARGLRAEERQTLRAEGLAMISPL
jgi:hypothetical protein